MYFIGVDLGTSGLKAGIIDEYGNIISSSYWETTFTSAQPGQMEQNIDDFFNNTLQIIGEIVEKAKIIPSEIGGVVIDGQMGSVIGIDREYNSVTGLDMNLDLSSEKYNVYMHQNFGDLLAGVTCGSPLNGQKIMWWKEVNPDFYKHIYKFITLNGYIAGKLAGLKADEAFIDHTLLAFSGIDDARELDWSEEICDRLNIDMSKLPEVVSPWKIVGGIDKKSAVKCGLKEGTPVFAGAGDQAVGFLGTGLIQPGSLIDVSGSSTILSLCVDRFVPDIENHAVMYIPSVKKGLYYAFTYINGGGIALKWFMDEFCGRNKNNIQLTVKDAYDEITKKAARVPPGSGGLLFIPYFGGRQCPYDSSIRGGWIGLNWGHRKEYLYRAILESIAFDFRLGYKHIKNIFTEIDIHDILVTGGGSKSEIWNQIKADVMGMRYIRLGSYEYNLRGCGIIAAFGSGLYDTIDSAVLKMENNMYEKIYVPDMDNHKIYTQYFHVFENAFQKNLIDTFHSLSEV